MSDHGLSILGIAVAEFKGAFAGGLMVAILDRGPLWRRVSNGVGAVAFAIVLAPGIVDIVDKFVVKKSDALTSAVAAVVALTGIIVAEALQRIARRFLARSESLGDKIADKVIGSDIRKD